MTHFKPHLPDPTLIREWKDWARRLNDALTKFFLAERGVHCGTVTLATSGTTTTLVDRMIYKGDRILLTPQDAGAAADIAGIFVPQATVDGSVIITHPVNAGARNLTYAIVG